MAQSTPYTRLSDLLGGGLPNQTDTASIRCEYVMGLIEDALLKIDFMTNDERETLMKSLASWMIAEKFGPHARPVLQGLLKYNIAECLFEDSAWDPPIQDIYFSR